MIVVLVEGQRSHGSRQFLGYESTSKGWRFRRNCIAPAAWYVGLVAPAVAFQIFDGVDFLPGIHPLFDVRLVIVDDISSKCLSLIHISEPTRPY